MTLHIKQKSCRFCNNLFMPEYRQSIYCSTWCRFWAKADIANINQCWEWKGARHPENYGHFREDPHIVVCAHRVGWELFYGKIPNDLIVCHHCDNPPCVNPFHLFLGTKLDNAQDRDKKSRRSPLKGAYNSSSKLSYDIVRVIEHRLSLKHYIKDIANDYDIGTTTVSRIKNKNHWASYRI